MSVRALLIPLLALTFGLLLVAACGGDDGAELPTGLLTDPRTVPTATPWTEPPEPTILQPEALTPIAEEGISEEEEEGGGEESVEVTPVDCGDTYTIQSGDNPSVVAVKCGVALQDLLDANPGIDPTSLRVGQELKIPQ